MDKTKYVDSAGKQIKLGHRVKFRAYYGQKFNKVIETEGAVMNISEYQQITVRLQEPYLADDGKGFLYKADFFILHGQYDHDRDLSVFGAPREVGSFTPMTKLEQYCLVMEDEIKPVPKKEKKKRVKVFGGTHFYKDDKHPHRQYRVLVVAATKKAAAEMVSSTMSNFNFFFCETGNKVELELVDGHEGGMWVAALDAGRKKEDYCKIK